MKKYVVVSDSQVIALHRRMRRRRNTASIMVLHTFKSADGKTCLAWRGGVLDGNNIVSVYCK